MILTSIAKTLTHVSQKLGKGQEVAYFMQMS